MPTREIQSQGFEKDVQIDFKPTQTLKGKYLGGRPIANLKNKILFEFAVMAGTTADTRVRLAPREYEAVDVELGDKVGLWETAQLKNKLTQVKAGEVVEITYNGKLSISEGRTCHDFSVKVVE